MQLRATFESVKTDDPDLFVVRIVGHLGTRERRAVEDLVEGCRRNGKKKVVFDFAGIESLGGSVAKVLGAFARTMDDEGHPPWFVGVSSVVRSFLTARFDDVVPRFAEDLEAAREALDRPVPPRSGPADGQDADTPAHEAARTPDPPASPDAVVDEVTEAVETLRAEELLAEDEEDEVDPPRVPSVAEDGVVVRRHSYLTLADAQPMLQELGDVRAARPILEGLLHGADLAETARVFVLEGDRLVEDQPPDSGAPRWLPATGEVGTILQRRAGPVDLVDLAEADLGDAESEVLTELNCQVAVPLFVDARMEAIFFVRKSQAGEDYVSSEELALDLLARQIGQDLSVGRRRQRGETGPEEKKLRGQLRRQRTVLRLSRELHAIADEDQLVSRLMISLIGEMGVASAIYFVVEDGALVPRHCYGIDEDEVSTLAVADARAIGRLDESVHPESADPEVWGEAASRLHEAGIDVVFPMRAEGTTFGLLAIAARRSRDGGNFDPEYVRALVHQAAVAAEHLRAVQGLEDQTLRVAKTLIALVERHAGTGDLKSTDLVCHYVARVGERLNVDPATRRELLYGAVLRDVGMIEISDIVLKSPRRLTSEEWKLVQRHPINGVDVLRAMDFSDVTCDVVLHHHERYNGEGYPHRLRGTAIPLGARIVSVVESYVTMIRETAYRAALSSDEAVAVLEENWEMRYDPVVIETFVDVLREDPDPVTDGGTVDLLSEIAAE